MYYYDCICLIIPPIFIFMTFKRFYNLLIDKSPDNIIINFTNCYMKALRLEKCIMSLCILHFAIMQYSFVYWLSFSHYIILIIHNYFYNYELCILNICTLYCIFIWMCNENMHIFGYGFLFIWNVYSLLKEVSCYYKNNFFIYPSIYISPIQLLFFICNLEHLSKIKFTIQILFYFISIMWILLFHYNTLFNEYKKINKYNTYNE